jgi:hypothetical protein
MGSSSGSTGFLDLPREIATSILQLCEPSTVSYLLATCRGADTYLRTTEAKSLWDGLLSQHFGSNWLHIVQNRVGVDHKTPLWTIYFGLAEKRHIDFRVETSDGAKLHYPFIVKVSERHHSDGSLRIVVAGELHPGKVRSSFPALPAYYFVRIC